MRTIISIGIWKSFFPCRVIGAGVFFLLLERENTDCIDIMIRVSICHCNRYRNAKAFMWKISKAGHRPCLGYLSLFGKVRGRCFHDV